MIKVDNCYYWSGDGQRDTFRVTAVYDTRFEFKYDTPDSHNFQNKIFSQKIWSSDYEIIETRIILNVACTNRMKTKKALGL